MGFLMRRLDIDINDKQSCLFYGTFAFQINIEKAMNKNKH